jgi:ribosomal protein S18 acetylase RimI-like enzyme
MPEKLIIRDGRVKDGEKALAVWNEFMDYHKRISVLDNETVPEARDMWAKYFVKFVRSRLRKVIVAELDGEIIGFLLGEIQKRPPIFKTSRQAFVDSICVREKNRNQGIGSMMLNAFSKWAQEKKMPFIMLNVVVENDAAIGCYRKHGYKTVILSQRKLI